MKRNESLNEQYFSANGFLSPSQLDKIDTNMLSTVVFLTDIGMDVISCHLNIGNKNKSIVSTIPGHISFAYDVYTKNIFGLLDIDVREELVADEYLLVYYFENKEVLNEHIKRIGALFKANT